MANEIKFLPRRQGDVLKYGAHVHGTVTASGYDPARIGLTPADVAELGALVAADQSAHNEVNALLLRVKAMRKTMSGPNGTHRQLVVRLRALASTARNSSATNGDLAAIGVSRKSTKPSPRNVPQEAPEFSVAGVTPGRINIRFRVMGSAAPRARAANAIGVQIAVVDGTRLEADNEAETALNLFVPRSPANLDSAKMPGKVRLYARWITRRGQTGSWSLPVPVSVI
jgi:hypothetical protein